LKTYLLMQRFISEKVFATLGPSVFGHLKTRVELNKLCKGSRVQR
jgi:hypothetical protein